jgi:hypothetical protein
MRKRIISVALVLMVLFSITGCDLNNIGASNLHDELASVINGYGQGLVNSSIDEAMSHISYSYYDAKGKVYGERKGDVVVALFAGDYLDYYVSLDYWREFGNEATAMGELTTVYRLGSNAVITNTDAKEWTFRRENGRWRILSEKAR